ncbi:LOW QUALITY PROTEIN: Hypothetical protein PHPALM_20875 [Phytophthora palmivora]|uniref:Tf2-1-like SH3-like domain-containing protein n=1 Tax=Phytophthora palmivora TaxID=4796 RepID=A0A2P4XDR1_9STRA|nr:LOW QUALITY PROTEIN: Hypothetical protein PHPALM_20875 [Phytophthora palmivora]
MTPCFILDHNCHRACVFAFQYATQQVVDILEFPRPYGLCSKSTIGLSWRQVCVATAILAKFANELSLPEENRPDYFILSKYLKIAGKISLCIFVVHLPVTKPHKFDAVMAIDDRWFALNNLFVIATQNSRRSCGNISSSRKIYDCVLAVRSSRLSMDRLKLPTDTLETIFAPINPHQNNWHELFSVVKFAYNTRVHASISMALFVADLGYMPRSLVDLQVPICKRLLLWSQDALDQAQQRMKFYHDHNLPISSFVVGDKVLLDTTNLSLRHAGNHGKRSLAAKYVGYYPVLAITTPDAYKLGLPTELQLHDNFHASRLRRYNHDDSASRDDSVPALITWVY